MLLPNVTGYLKPWSKFIKFLSTDIWVKVPNTGDDQIHTLKFLNIEFRRCQAKQKSVI